MALVEEVVGGGGMYSSTLGTLRYKVSTQGKVVTPVAPESAVALALTEEALQKPAFSSYSL